MRQELCWGYTRLQLRLYAGAAKPRNPLSFDVIVGGRNSVWSVLVIYSVLPKMFTLIQTLTTGERLCHGL